MILAATDIVNNFPVNIISCTWEFCEHNQLLLMGVFVNIISCSWEFCEQAMVPHCAQANPVRAAVQPCMHVWQSLKFRGSSCCNHHSEGRDQLGIPLNVINSIHNSPQLPVVIPNTPSNPHPPSGV